MPLLLQVRRHAASHDSQTNESNFHFFYLSSRGRDQLRFVNILSFDLRDFFVGKMKGGRVHVSFHLLGVASTDDGTGHGRISQRPRNRNLTGRTLNPLADFSHTLDQRETSRKPRILKFDVATSPITGRKSGGTFSRH